MKTVWTLNTLDELADYRFDYKLFETREDAVEAMNVYKNCMIKTYELKVLYRNDNFIALAPENYDGESVVQMYKMWVRETIIH